MLLICAATSLAAPKMKTVDIGKTRLEVDLPAEMIAENDGNDALLAYLPYKAFVTLRFTVLSINAPVKGNARSGVDFVKKKAAENKQQLFLLDDRCFYQETREAELDGEKTIQHFIYVGYEQFTVVIYCSILSRMKDDPAVVKVLEYTGPAIRSLHKKIL